MRGGGEMTLEERVKQLERRVATLEVQAQGRPNEKFIPEDSNGKRCDDNEKMTFKEYCNTIDS